MDVRRKFLKNVFFAALSMFIGLPGYAQTIYTWNTGIGNWNTAANWLPNGVPGANDNAIINSGTVLLTTNVTVSGLTLSNGTIYGAGKLSIAGAFTWSGGDMDGDTTLAGIDTTEVLPGGVIIISGLNSKDLRGRVLINNGVATWSEPGNLNMRNNSVLLNRSGATFNIQTDATLDGAAPTGGILVNEGTLNKNGSSGTAIIDAVIQNSGAISVSAGTLRLKEGGTHTGASITVSTNRTLQFFGGLHSLDGVTIGGNGTLEVLLDSVAIGASGMTINSPGNLEMLGGSLSSSAPVTVNGNLKWSRGTIKGSGIYNINGSLLIQGDNAKTLDGATISLAGAATWSGLGDLRLKNGAVLQTLPGSNFNIQNSAQLDFAVPGGGSFNHAGTLAKTGAGATTIDLEMANNGAVNLNSGTLVLDRGSNNSGVFNIAAGAALNIGGGTHSFNPAAAVTGDGNLNFTGTGVSDFNGAYNSSGALAVSAGTVNFNGSFGGNGSAAITGGILNLNNVSALANVTQGGGTFGGSGNITVNNAYAWNGGAIGGSGSVTVNGALTINGTSIKTLDGITLANAGTAALAGAGRIDLKNNAQLLNQPGGNFNIESDVEIDFATPNGGTFINAGTLTRSVAAGDLLIDAVFNNNGTFNLNSGNLRLTRGGVSTGGTFNINAGSLLQYASGVHSLDNVTFTGSGTVELTGNTGNLQVNGGGAVFDPGIPFQMNNGILDGNGSLVVNGPFTWSRGTIGGSGNFNFNGPFSISGDNAKTIDGQTVSNSAVLTWTGLGDIRLKNNAVLENQPGGTFDIQSQAQIDFAVPDGGTFINNGTVNKNNGAGTTVIDVALQNNGGFNIGAGSVNLQRGGNSSGGTFTIGVGATLQFNGGVHTLSGLTVNGEGTAVLTGSGTLNATGSGMTLASPAVLDMLSGVFDSDGPTIINGTFNWNAGTLTGSGSFTVNGALHLPGGAAKTLDGLTLTNAGAVNLNGGGNLRFANNAVLANQVGGVFDIQTDAGLEFIAPAGGLVNNYGTAIKSNGAGATTVNVNFNNYGILDANSGKITFTKTLLNDVAGTLQGSDTIGVGTAAFLNNGNVKPGSSPGMLTISGTYPQSAAGTLHIEVGGYTPGVQYDRLKVVGAAQLSGTLKVVLANNFVPAIGDTFKVMSYTSRAGQFAAFVPPTIGGQPMFDLEYKSTGVVLRTLQVNQLPLANDDHINVSEDLAATFNALANDLDPDGDAISISFFSQPLHGAASQVGDSSFQYVPAENYFGPDTFRYAVMDDNGASDTAQVIITVLPVNDPPVISSPLPEVSFPEDSSATLNLTPYASDVDNSVAELSWSAQVIGAQFLSAAKRNALPNYEAELHTIVRSVPAFRDRKEKSSPNLQPSMFNLQSSIEVDPEDLQIVIDPASGIASFSATLDSSGVFTVVFTLSDPGGLWDSDTITVTVSAVGDPPFVANPIADLEFAEDGGPVIAAANLHEVFSDPDPGTTFSFSAVS
ncbi:MAG: Ig-like domain-containing protein, partial [Calditrichia bacterium]|nr:Ig-like domain-containing protein [Calditrichia bacterium]